MRLGLLVPTSKVWRPFGEPLEVHRCDTDRRIVTRSQSSVSKHPGHYIRQPVLLSLFELILIWLRVIK
jgi:hypothetical protein